MTKHVAITTKKILAASGAALSLAGLGMFVGAGIAAADGTNPDTGTYDELLKVVKDPIQVTHAGSYGSNGSTDMGTYDALLNILDPNGFQGDRP